MEEVRKTLVAPTMSFDIANVELSPEKNSDMLEAGMLLWCWWYLDLEFMKVSSNNYSLSRQGGGFPN